MNRILWNIDTVWHTLIHRFVKRYELDVLHVHDLRLVSTGLSVAKKYHLPVVADLHENYPALMQLLKGKKSAKKGLKQWEKWDKIESLCTAEAARVITVIEEAKTRLVDKGIAPEKIVVLPNTVDIEKFEKAPVDQAVIRRFKSSFLLTYVGHVNGRHRGIHTVIEAMALLKEEIPELFFMAAGAVRDDYLQELMTLVAEKNLQSQVDFTGWLDERDFVSYIQASDICLCPHLANDHTDATFPNKVYLYHLFGKPVVTSDCKPLERYIQETQGGVCYPSGNAQALADQIRQLYAQPELRKQLGEQGRIQVLETHNWEQTSARLLGMYGAFRRDLPPTLVPFKEPATVG